MKITSNNIIYLEELFNSIKEDEIIDVTKEPLKKDIKGVDFIINITVNIDLSTLLLIFASSHYMLKDAKLFLKNSDGEEEIIDTEIIENPDAIEIHKEKVIELKKFNSSELYVEFRED